MAYEWLGDIISGIGDWWSSSGSSAPETPNVFSAGGIPTGNMPTTTEPSIWSTYGPSILGSAIQGGLGAYGQAGANQIAEEQNRQNYEWELAKLEEQKRVNAQTQLINQQMVDAQNKAIMQKAYATLVDAITKGGDLGVTAANNMATLGTAPLMKR